MISLHLTETGHVPYRLTTDQGRALAASGVVSAVPSPHQAGLWEVASRGGVGAARIGDMEIWIAPKLPIERLLFLVGYATDPQGWRDELVGFDTAEGLVPAVADALCRQAEQALRAGLLQGYRTVEETSAVLRGRLREADQLRRHHGQVIPMEIRHDDFTTDIAENQILLAAIIRLGSVPRIAPAIQRRLAALHARLRDVSLPVLGTRLPSWQPNRLNRRYHLALRLAEIVWRATPTSTRCSPTAPPWICPGGTLSMPGATPTRPGTVVQHANIGIVCHALDLEVTPTKLLAQVARIADGIVRRPQPA